MKTNETSGPGLLSSLWRSLWTSPRPAMGCEISQSGVSIAKWSRAGSSLDLAAWRAVAPGAIEASPLRENVHDAAEVDRAFQEALSSLGISTVLNSRGAVDIVLIIPDQSVRLFVLDFDKLPRDREEGQSLVRFRLKKSLPFDVDTAAISYFVQKPGGAPQVVAVASPGPVVRQYEAIPLKYGFRPTVAIPSSLAALQLTPAEAAPEGSGAAGGNGNSGAPGALFIKYSPPWFTMTILQSGVLRLFRTVNLIPRDDGMLVPEAVLAAVYPSIVYFQDTFHASVGSAFGCGIGENAAVIASALGADLGLKMKMLATVAATQEKGGDPHLSERHFSALLGMARER